MNKPVYFNKLVRDKIPEIISKNGSNPTIKVLNGEEYKIAIFEKLKEECAEVISAENKEHLTEELADLFEVIHSIIKNQDITFEEIEKVRLSKKEKRGGFDEKIFLISSEKVNLGGTISWIKK